MDKPRVFILVKPSGPRCTAVQFHSTEGALDPSSSPIAEVVTHLRADLAVLKDYFDVHVDGYDIFIDHHRNITHKGVHSRVRRAAMQAGLVVIQAE